MAAIVNMSGGVISLGYNHYRATMQPSIHAEMHALINAISSARVRPGQSVNIVVVRDDNRNSRPCSNCINSIINHSQLNIQKVYYTTLDVNTGMVMETCTDLANNADHHVSRGNIQQTDDEDDPVKT